MVERQYPGCTGPHADLIVDDDLLRSSLFIKTIETPSDACYVEEGCLGGTGSRKVLAFSTQVHNIGCAPFVVGVPTGNTKGCWDDGNPWRRIQDGCPPFSPPSPGPPSSPPHSDRQRRLRSDGNQPERPTSNTSNGHYSRGQAAAAAAGGSTTGRYPSRRRLDNGWSWHDCHQHWHYDNYAHYALRDLCTDKDVAWEDRPVVGHKNGWCVSDTGTYGGGTRCIAAGLTGDDPDFSRGMHGFTCSNMGISPGCSDKYASYLDCQWIDITDLPDGQYWLTVRIVVRKFYTHC